MPDQLSQDVASGLCPACSRPRCSCSHRAKKVAEARMRFEARQARAHSPVTDPSSCRVAAQVAQETREQHKGVDDRRAPAAPFPLLTGPELREWLTTLRTGRAPFERRHVDLDGFSMQDRLVGEFVADVLTIYGFVQGTPCGPVAARLVTRFTGVPPRSASRSLRRLADSGAFERRDPLPASDPHPKGTLVFALPGSPEPQAAAESRAEGALRWAVRRLDDGAGRNRTGYDLAKTLRKAGLSYDEAWPVMRRYHALAPPRDHDYELDEARRTLRSVYKEKR